VRAAGVADLLRDATALAHSTCERRDVDHRHDRREIRGGGGHDRSGPVSQNRRRETDTDPEQAGSGAAEASEEATPVAIEAAEQLRGFANELAAWFSALGGLASAEASLSLTAFMRMLGLRVLGILLLALAIALLAGAATLVLEQALGSSAAALGIVALAASLCAALALWRARVWRERIGFVETRAALESDATPREEPRP
jgi:hypothetical protein